MRPGKKLGVDLGTSGGDWLFRQGELVLGPVPAAQIVEKLYAGDLDGRSEVQRLGSGRFIRLSEVDFFKVHLAKAEAKQRVDRSAAELAQTQRRRRRLKIALVVAVTVPVAAGAAAVATVVASRSRPTASPQELWDDLGLVSVGAPVIGRAKAHKDEDLLDYPGGPSTSRTERPSSGAVASADRPSRTSKAQLTDAADDPDGMQTAKFDQGSINAVVASKQKTLFPCLVAEAQKSPGLNAKIPIEFVIGNDGRVAKLWIDHPTFREGPLKECLFRELQKWPFKPYEGERATVGLSFKIGKG
ncbi:MAG: AgmX/PglI C-terminal domain-containing protein [Myxococcales bacterium]|nr:AgmX/PglI C-terminal domain-containing protein [Myxococcales bacterium]